MLTAVFVLGLVAAESSSYVDEDTPSTLRTKTGSDGSRLSLIFSDEFERSGRSFDDGHDPVWTALDKDSNSNEQLNSYIPENVYTSDGSLKIRNFATQGQDVGGKRYRSGMVQSWNKFCFTHGVVEASVKLPGSAQQSGLWPAFWLMGNLARANYDDSAKGLWPYSYDAPCPENQVKKVYQ